MTGIAMVGVGSTRQMGLDQALKEARGLHAAGRLDEAAAIYRQILNQLPDQPVALSLMGAIALQRGDLPNAVGLMRRGVANEPRNAEAWGHLGIALHRSGKHGEALDAFDRCLALSPEEVGIILARALLLTEIGRPGEALSAYDRAISLDPLRPVALMNRANLHAQAGRMDLAITGFQAACAAAPRDPRCYYKLAVALRSAGRSAESRGAFETSLSLDPKFPGADTGLGIVLAELGKNEEALAAFDRALLKEPEDLDAHFNRGFALLCLERWAEAWPEYEWRRRLPDNPAKTRQFTQPEWDGRALSEERLMLYAEQGLGDTFQFLRYASIAKARGARVILECQASLKGLLSRSPGIEKVVARGEPLPPFDLHAPLMSLPRIFATNPATIPAVAPYIAADPVDIEARRQQLAFLGRPRVGLAWQGTGAAIKSDRQRSIPLSLWSAILRQPDVAFVSLQVDPGRTQLAEIDGVHRPVDPFADSPPRDFADTAAILADLDLVISIDTAIAHLAGAMGLPTWIMLPHVADWRWGREGDRSAWYPTMRLFRQRRPGDWTDVLEQVEVALNAHLHDSR